MFICYTTVHFQNCQLPMERIWRDRHIGKVIQINTRRLRQLIYETTSLKILQVSGILLENCNVCVAATTKELIDNFKTLLSTPMDVCIYSLGPVQIHKKVYVQIQQLNSLGYDVYLCTKEVNKHWLADMLDIYK